MDRSSSSSQKFPARSSPNSYNNAWSPSMINSTARKTNGHFRLPDNTAESWTTERSAEIHGGPRVKRNLEKEFFGATDRMENHTGSYRQDSKNVKQSRLQKYQKDHSVSLTNQDRLVYQSNKPNLLTTDYGSDKDNLMFAQNVTPGYLAREAKKIEISPLARSSPNSRFIEPGNRLRRFQSLSEGNSPILTRSSKITSSEDYDPRYNHWQDTSSTLQQQHRSLSNGLTNYRSRPNGTSISMQNQLRTPSNGLPNPSKPYYDTPDPRSRFNSDYDIGSSNTILRRPLKSKGFEYVENELMDHEQNGFSQHGSRGYTAQKRYSGEVFARIEEDYDFNGTKHTQGNGVYPMGIIRGEERQKGGTRNREQERFSGRVTFAKEQTGGQLREGRDTLNRNSTQYDEVYKDKDRERSTCDNEGIRGQGRHSVGNVPAESHMNGKKQIRVGYANFGEISVRGTEGNIDSGTQEKSHCNGSQNFREQGSHIIGGNGSQRIGERDSHIIRGNGSHIVRGSGSHNFREQDRHIIRGNDTYIFREQDCQSIGGNGSYISREQRSNDFSEQDSLSIREQVADCENEQDRHIIRGNGSHIFRGQGTNNFRKQVTHSVKQEDHHIISEKGHQNIREQVTNSVRDIPERGYLKNSVTNAPGILKSREANSASLKRINQANEDTVDRKTHTDCAEPKDKKLTATIKQCIVRELNLDQANNERKQRADNTRMGVQFVLTGTGQSKEKEVDNIITLIGESFTDCELDRRENELRMEKSRWNDRTIKSVNANSQREIRKEISVGLTAGCSEVVGAVKNTNARTQSNGIQAITASSGFDDVSNSESVFERYSSTDNEQNLGSKQTNIGLCSFEQIKRQLLHEAGLKEEKIDVTRSKTSQCDQRDQTRFVKTIHQNIAQQGLESDRCSDGAVYVVNESYGKIVYNNEKNPEDLIVSRTPKTQAKVNRNNKSPFIRTVYQDCGRGSARFQEINSRTSRTSGRPVSPESDSIITAVAGCNKERQPQNECVRLRRRDRKLRYLSEPGNFSKHGAIYSRRFDVNSDRSADDMESRSTHKLSDDFHLRNSQTDVHGLTENALKAHTEGLKVCSPSVRRRPTLNQFFGKIQEKVLQQDSSSDNSDISCCSDSVLMIQKANKFNLTPVSGLMKDGSSNSAARAKRLKAWKSRHEKVPKSDRPSAAELLMKEQCEGARGNTNSGVLITAKAGNSCAEKESCLKSSESETSEERKQIYTATIVNSSAENENWLQSPKSKTRLLHSMKPCGQANENSINCVENNKQESVFQERENIKTRSNKRVMFSETASLHGAGSYENKSTTLKANKGNKVILNYTTDHDVNVDKDNKEMRSSEIGFGSQDSFEEVFVEPELLSCTPQRIERGATNHDDQMFNHRPDLEPKPSLNCEQEKDPLDTFVGSASAVLERVKRLKLKYNFKPANEKLEESSSDLSTDSNNQRQSERSNKLNESNNNLCTDSRNQTEQEDYREGDSHSIGAKVVRVSLDSNTIQSVSQRSNDSRIELQDSRIDHKINHGFRVQISKRSSCSLEELRPDINLNTVKSPCHSSEEDLRFFKKSPRREVLDNKETFSGIAFSTMTNEISEADEGIRSACHSSEEDLRLHEQNSADEMNDNKEKNSNIVPPTMTNKEKEFDGIRSPSEKLIQAKKSTNTNGNSHHETSSSNNIKSQAKQKDMNRITAENDRLRLESGYESCTEREENKDCSLVENVTEVLIRPDARNENRVSFEVRENENIQTEAVNDGVDLELRNNSRIFDPVSNCSDQLYLTASGERFDEDQSDEIKRNFVANFKEKDGQEIAGLESELTGVLKALSNDSERIFKDKDGEISHLIDPKDKIECRDLANKRAGLTLKGKWIDGQSKANSTEVHEGQESTNFNAEEIEIGGGVLGGPTSEQRRHNLDIESKEPAVYDENSDLIIGQSKGNSSVLNEVQESSIFDVKKGEFCGDISDKRDPQTVNFDSESKVGISISRANYENTATGKDIACLNIDSRDSESRNEIYGIRNESSQPDILAGSGKSFDNDDKSNLELIAKSSTFHTSGIIAQQLHDNVHYGITNITPFGVRRSDSVDSDCESEDEMAYAKGVSDLKKHFEKWQPEQEKRENGTPPKDLQETDGSRKTPSKLHALKSMFESPSPTQSKWRAISGEIRIGGKVTKVMTSPKLKNLVSVVNKRDECSPTLDDYDETFSKAIETGVTQSVTPSTAMQINSKESNLPADRNDGHSQSLGLEKGKEETIMKIVETRNETSGQPILSAQKVKKVPPPIKRKPSLKKKETEKPKVNLTNEAYANGNIDGEIKVCDQSLPVVSAKEGTAEHRNVMLKNSSAEESVVARKHESSQMTSIIPEIARRGHIDISQRKIDESEGGNKLNEKEHARVNDDVRPVNSQENVRENAEGVDGIICKTTQLRVAHESTKFVLRGADSGSENGEIVSGVMDVKNRCIIAEMEEENVAEDSCEAEAKPVDYLTAKERYISAETGVDIASNKQTAIVSHDVAAKERCVSEKSEANIAATDSTKLVANAFHRVTGKEQVQREAEKENALTFEKSEMILSSEHTQKTRSDEHQQSQCTSTEQCTIDKTIQETATKQCTFDQTIQEMSKEQSVLEARTGIVLNRVSVSPDKSNPLIKENQDISEIERGVETQKYQALDESSGICCSNNVDVTMDRELECVLETSRPSRSSSDSSGSSLEDLEPAASQNDRSDCYNVPLVGLPALLKEPLDTSRNTEQPCDLESKESEQQHPQHGNYVSYSEKASDIKNHAAKLGMYTRSDGHGRKDPEHCTAETTVEREAIQEEPITSVMIDASHEVNSDSFIGRLEDARTEAAPLEVSEDDTETSSEAIRGSGTHVSIGCKIGQPFTPVVIQSTPLTSDRGISPNVAKVSPYFHDGNSRIFAAPVPRFGGGIFGSEDRIFGDAKVEELDDASKENEKLGDSVKRSLENQGPCLGDLKKLNVTLQIHRDHLEPKDINLGMISIDGMKYWDEIEDEVTNSFLGHLKQIDENCLSLMKEDIKYLQIGRHQVALGGGMDLRNYPINGEESSCTISLQDAGKCSLSWLSYQSLIPKRTLEKYLSLAFNHHCLIFCGPSGTGKSYLASNIAKVLAVRIGKGDNNNVPDPVHTSNVNAERWEEIKKLIVQRIKESMPVILVIDGFSPEFHEGMEYLSTLLKQLGNRRVYVVAALCQSTDQDVAVRWQNSMRWIWLDNNEEPVKGLLSRYLRKKFLLKDFSLKSEELFKIANWISNLWKHLNRIIEKFHSTTQTIGPAMFFSCPTSKDEIEEWFADLWNYSLAPYLLHTMRTGLKIFGQRCDWTDPLEWIRETYPWQQKGNLLHKLKKVRKEDVEFRETNADIRDGTSKEQVRLMNFLRRLETLVDDDKKITTDIKPGTTQRRIYLESTL